MLALSKIIAVVIIVAVTIAISIAYAMWLIGVANTAGYGTRPVRLDIYSFQKFGPMYRLILRNAGSESLLVDEIYINDKPSTIKLVYDLDNPDRYFRLYTRGVNVRSDPIRIDPGQRVSVIGIPPVELKSGRLYSIRIKTTVGFQSYVPLEISSAIPIEMYMIRLVALTDTPVTRVYVSVDGGVDAWLNGRKILSRLTDSVSSRYWNYAVGVRGVLREGENVLALHVKRNTQPTSYVDAEIRAECKQWDPSVPGMRSKYFLFLRLNRTWRYTITTPPSNWYAPGFNDTGWETGEAPIGDTLSYATRISFTDLYARKTVAVPSSIGGVGVAGIAYAELRIASDDGAAAYINGVKVLDRLGDSHGGDYWNYHVDVTSSLAVGENTVAVHVHNSGGSSFFDAELYVIVTLRDGSTATLVYPARTETRYLAGQAPPSGWYSPGFNDTGWSTGVLPIGDHDGARRPNTVLSYDEIYVRVKFNITWLPLTLIDGVYRERHSGYTGWLVEFSPVTWEYRFWRLYNPDGDPRTTDDMVLVGGNNAVGDLENPPPPLYSGESIVVQSYEGRAHRYVVSTPGGYGIDSPFIIVLNPSVRRGSNYTWYNLNEAVKYKYIREPVDRAIQGLDFIILWEDLWHGPPPTTTWTWNDSYSLIDHVVRVTWREDGSVRVGVYRCSGGYLHVFILGAKYIYYKPHGDNWGETTGGTPNPRGIWWYTDTEGFYVEYERGLPLRGHDHWISPTGYRVQIWEIK